MPFTDDEIVALAEEKNQENLGRNRLYDTLDKIYWENAFTGELDKLISPETRRSKQDKLVVNFVKARVKDKINLLTMLPDITEIRWIEPTLQREDELIFSEALHAILLDHWGFSNMGMVFREMAHFLSLRGTSVEMIFPDFKNKRPTIIVRDPKTVSADISSKSPTEYDWVLFQWEEEGRRILSTYPEAEVNKIDKSKDKFKLVEFWDKDVRRLFANGKPIPGRGVKHNLGFIPIRITPNVRVPGRIEGISDVSHEIGLQENLNDLILLTTEEIRERLESLMVIKGAKDLPKRIPSGRGSYVQVGPEGDVQFRSRVSNPADTASHLQSQENLFRVATSWPLQRSGIIPSAIWTGKGIDASQSAVSDEAQTTKEAIGQDMVLINDYILALDKKMFGNEKRRAYIPRAEEPFTYIPKKDYPDKFTHKLVFFPLGHDIPTMIVNLLQLYGQKVFDLRTVLERIPGVNPSEVMRRLEEDRRREMEMMREVQEMTQPPPEETPQGSTPEEVERFRANLEAGGLPASPLGGR